MENIMMLTTIVVALITAVFGPIAVAWAKNKFTSKPSTCALDDAISLNTLVDEQLESMMVEMEADRIWVSQFHNGGHFYPTGKSIQKFSIFYEKTTPGTLPSQHTFQNIPCSLFAKSLAELNKEGEIAVPNFNNYNTFDLQGVAEQHGTKSFYLISLEDLNGKFTGTLAISYNEEYKFDKDDWIYIRQKAGVIGTLLDNYLNAPK
tara:strand:- start:513 stop:1127 length:615 start_codon:yes stop_codon:yes gene_type:complete